MEASQVRTSSPRIFLFFPPSNKVSWASDLNRVREFLAGYVRSEPQSEPALQLDEVTRRSQTESTAHLKC